MINFLSSGNTELDALNKAVDDAIAARKKWMDDNMEKFAKFKIGEEIYDISKNPPRFMGIVKEYYRIWGDDRDSRYDRSMNIHYRFTNGSNTSSQIGVRFGTMKDWEDDVIRQVVRS
jgi:hypothetical protein